MVRQPDSTDKAAVADNAKKKKEPEMISTRGGGEVTNDGKMTTGGRRHTASPGLISPRWHPSPEETVQKRVRGLMEWSSETLNQAVTVPLTSCRIKKKKKKEKTEKTGGCSSTGEKYFKSRGRA